MAESDQDNCLEVLLYIVSAVRGSILISVRESKQRKVNRCLITMLGAAVKRAQDLGDVSSLIQSIVSDCYTEPPNSYHVTPAVLFCCSSRKGKQQVSNGVGQVIAPQHCWILAELFPRALKGYHLHSHGVSRRGGPSLVPPGPQRTPSRGGDGPRLVR